LYSRPCQLLFTAVIGSVYLPAYTTYAQEEPTPDDEVVYLSPFEVNAEDNTGYVASNSISGTRSQTPIREIPLNIQVITKDFAQDLNLTSQIDMERYNAALVNGGDDAFSNNVIQQSYNGFLFRGFVQNWSLRDGVRGYDPVDAQGISRVEIVKGPAAALYGVTYPGGVMNTISKSAMIGRSFVEVGAAFGSYGEWRTTLDANVTSQTRMGDVAVRYNGVYSETADNREHSEGLIRFNQVGITLAPTKNTILKLTFEDAYRETPTALGYYFKDETDANGNSLGNGASIPIQEVFGIDYDWNWSTGNMRSCEDKLYKADLTQSIGENLTINAYASYSKRVQIDSDGLDANGSSGAGSWDCNSNTGWMNANTPSLDDDYLAYQYHYIDWRNQNRAVGITAVGKFEVLDGAIENTITTGAHGWYETFYSWRGEMPTTSPNYVILPIKASLDTVTKLDRTPPMDYYRAIYYMAADGKLSAREQHEKSQNEYYFVSWQAKALDGRLHTTAAVNYTTLDLKVFKDSASTELSNRTEEQKTSPMFGAMFDITKDISVFGVYSTSLFPTTTKDSFERQLPPIEGESYEFGVKFDMFDSKLSGTISYYIITQTGGYQRDFTADNANQVAWDHMTDAERIAAYGTADPSYRSQITDREGQLGDYVAGQEQESKGFEVDLAYQPLKNWQILFSYAHNDVEISDSLNEAVIGNIPTSGHISDQFALTTKYDFVNDALSGLFLGGGCQWANEAFQGYYNGVERYYPSTFYLEMFAGYKFKTMGVDSAIQLNVKNITGQEAYAGWKATGSANTIATDPYKIDVPIRFTLSYKVSF
jgi:outer membrane receptor protein involved in Fe transport